MKSLFALTTLGLALAAMPAFADDVTAGAASNAPIAAPVDPLTFNVGVASEYRYRGISQSRLNPALQGGADYAAESGWYIGAWASTIQWIKDAGGNAPVELDLYGGYKKEIVKDLTLDVGLLQYYYANNDLNPSANTLEVYAALSYGPLVFKYSDSVTNLFGFSNSKNSGYADLSGVFEITEGWTLTPHVGHQKVANNSAASYYDYSLTLNKDYAGITFGAALIGTNSGDYLSPAGKNLGKSTLVVSAKKTF